MISKINNITHRIFDRKVVKILFAYVLIGISLRLIYGLFFNHLLDITWHLAFARSVIDTGDLTEGFLAVVRAGDISQLHGKIWYQILNVWLSILDFVKLIDIDYLLDTKAFSDSANYLVGLRQWSPPLYQLVSIKLFQFFWDGILVFYLYKIAKRLNTPHPELIVLFWAVNPFLIMVGYGIMMTEIAMLAALVGGVYHWMKALDDESRATPHIIISMTLLALGAVIKQFPLLVVPFAILTLGKTKRHLLLALFTFPVSYYLLRQPWAGDYALSQSFFFFSEQSSGILEYTIASIPIFFILYTSTFLLFLQKKVASSTTSITVLQIVLIIASITYLSDATFFVQFLTWIVPFAALYSLSHQKYTWVFLLSMIALFFRAFSSHDYFAGMLTPTIGARFSDNLHPSFVIDQFIKFEYLDLFLNSLTKYAYGLLALTLIGNVVNWKIGLSERLTELKIPYNQLMWFSLIIFIGVVTVDYSVRSRYMYLPQKQFQTEWQELPLTRSGLRMNVLNPNNEQLTAVTLPLTRDNAATYDNTILEITTNEGELIQISTLDILLPTSKDERYTFFLPDPISSSEFTIELKKEYGNNKIVVYLARQLEQPASPGFNLYSGYDSVSAESMMTTTFPQEEVFMVYLRGQYRFQDMIKALSFHAAGTQKKTFFGLYISFAVLLLCVGSIMLYRYTRQKK